jgi:uncharacterized protein (DUF58 family)
MQYTPIKPRTDTPRPDSRIYADLDELVRLQFKATGFSYLPRQPVHSLLYGRHASRMRGRGLNFEELRHYLPGDDIRSVDWKASSRSGTPHVRVYSEERDRPVWLLVDQRPGMFFGSRDTLKSVIAAEAAAVSAWRVQGMGDRVGAMIFDDENIVTLRPLNSKAQVMRILGEVIRKNHALKAGRVARPGAGTLNESVRQLSPLVPHDGLVVLITDGAGADEETRRLVTRISDRNDVIIIFIYDPMEESMPDAGSLVMSDGNSQLEVNTGTRKLRDSYAGDFVQRIDRLKALSRRYAVPLLMVGSDMPVLDQVRDQLGHRARPRRW